MRKVPLLFIVSIVVLLSQCTSEEEKCAFIPDTKNIKIDLSYESLTDQFVGVESKDKLVELLTANPIIRDYFLGRNQYPNDSVFVDELFARFNNTAFDTLLLETKRVFGDESELKSEFTQAFANLRYYYPDFRIPKIQTMITGFDTDLYVSDSLIIVGLDYYLGPDAKYRPHMYDYLLQQYQKENIVPSYLLIQGIDSRFNHVSGKDQTVLADMIAYGKAFYFAKRMMPCTPDSIFIWYTQDEIAGARKNEDAIWFRFIENEVLYSTSRSEKQKFLSERPKTIEVGEKCPGRIGQFVGWEIVNSFMEHHDDVTLQQLMAMDDADRIFKESKYKPVKK